MTPELQAALARREVPSDLETGLRFFVVAAQWLKERGLNEGDLHRVLRNSREWRATVREPA